MPIGDAPVLNRINRFLLTPWYVLCVMALCAASNLFSLELPVYTLYALLVVFICLLGKDLLPLMPVIICSYLAPSAKNNPGRNESSVFSGASGVYLICLAGIIAVCLTVRILRERKRYFSARPKLLSGMLLLSGAYLLSGIGSAAYPESLGRNLLFAAIQAAALLLPYWLFSVGVDWEHVRKDYFAWIGFFTGGLLAVQVLGVYLFRDVVVNGIIQRETIFTGWGMYNNMGGLLAMMIPYAFCLATKYRKGWVGTVAGSVYLICLVLTCSRNAILTGSVVFGACVLLMLHYARNRRHNFIAIATVCVVLLAVVILFRQQLLRLFHNLVAIGLNPNNRDKIFAEGFKLFSQAPVFGSSFFSPGYQPWAWATSDGFNGFFPPRWHNTLVQLLASCGVVGLGAYGVHRVQTVKLFLRRKTKENAFIGCSLLVLVISSLFDCHFFNVGPVLFYAMALAFAENRP